jgi:hypothetical protein
MSYGFDKAKRPPVPPPAPEPRKLDLAGLVPTPLPEVSPQQEQAAIAAGERLGFGSREPGVISQPVTTPTEPQPSPRGVARARPSAPMKSLLIKGPVAVLDRFVAYTNETQARSYWEALDQLLKTQGK